MIGNVFDGGGRFDQNATGSDVTVEQDFGVVITGYNQHWPADDSLADVVILLERVTGRARTAVTSFGVVAILGAWIVC